MALELLPGNLLLAGFFLAACFISLSIGTSVGTIVALVPVIAGIAEKTDMNMAFMTAVVVGGAFFGDNLSFISDTTIAATRTQGCAMKDKFKVNFRIVLPAALCVLGYYIYRGFGMDVSHESYTIEWVKVLPYLVVLLTAFMGLNVMAVLILGIMATGLVGLFTGSISFFDWFGSLGSGISGMGELIIISLMAGGMLELIRFNGGVDYIIEVLTRRISGKKGAEICIAALVSIANVCTANNTIAIITVGPLTNDIATKYGVDKRKSASILDTFSCVIQGIIPYGAQMLMAAKLASISPISIIEYLYYPLGILVMAMFSIFARWPKKYS
jgi:Na+/H+ antiporter NhaC